MQGLAFVTRALAAVACLGLATSAAAAPAKKVKRSVALAPAQADGSVGKAQLDTIDRALANSAGANAEVVATRALDKRLTRGSFASAARACKGDGACLTKLAKAVKVELILAPVARPESDGTGVVTTVAGANDTVHRVSFVFVTAADLNAAIAYNAGDLFTPSQAVPEPALESLATLPLEPLAAPVEPPPVAKVDSTLPPLEAPPLEKPQPPAPLATTSNDTLSSPMTATRTISLTPQRRFGWETYVGASAAAVGIAAITYGVIQYTDHKNIVNDANADPTLTQRQAKARDDDAKSHYDKSRVGLYAGIPLAIIGAGLLTYDIAFASRQRAYDDTAMAERHLQLSLAPDLRGGAQGAVVFTW